MTPLVARMLKSLSLMSIREVPPVVVVA